VRVAFTKYVHTHLIVATLNHRHLLHIDAFSYLCFMYSKDQILSILRTKKSDLEARYPISELGLFGSYARGDNSNSSDIDILVDFNGPIGIRFIRLAHELEDLFNQKVDLISRKGIKPRYLPFVEKNLIHV
jgi:predicted nucleotidyltransferase